MSSWILTLVIFAPLAGVGALALMRGENKRAIERVALGASLAALVLAAVAAALFFQDAPKGGFGLKATYAWLEGGAGGGALPDGGGSVGGVDVAYRVGVDGISIWLLLLTAFLTPLAIASSFSAIQERVREYYILMLLLETAMLGVFCALDLLLFYIFFEFTLVPLFFLIGIWGGSERRRASVKFFLYTLAGSMITFAGVLYTAYYAYRSGAGAFTLNLEELMRLSREGAFPAGVQGWIFLSFAAGFAIKVPLFPLHTWLPLAHTEAPTAGSVILAGVLLKLGTYGFCRLSLPLLPEASRAFAPALAVLAIVGIIYTALAAWVQTDVKKLVAYSSVSHLGFCMLGLFSMKLAGMNGAVMYMINHGLSTGALFLVIGCLYERYHTREFAKLGGLARRMPVMAFFLMVFTLSSIGLPGLNGFIGEFLVLLGTATSGSTLDGLAPGPLGFSYAAVAATGIILGAVYMLYMCGRVLFGPLVEPVGGGHGGDVEHGGSVDHGGHDGEDHRGGDLTRREVAILAPIAALCLLLGVYPKPMLASIQAAAEANIFSVDDQKHAEGEAAPRGRRAAQANAEFGMPNAELTYRRVEDSREPVVFLTPHFARLLSLSDCGGDPRVGKAASPASTGGAQ
ncbi:MAG: NADH-quinone oxidoreductase subunit M [Phycisphaerae bacterium]|nr:NADH-quinone oxidoreductase subunit M [Phycisphaerae bacterium]